MQGVGVFVACTVKDGRGRHKVVAYGYDRTGSGHYSYSHMPGMDDFVGPLYGSRRCAAALQSWHVNQSSQWHLELRPSWMFPSWMEVIG